uniref:RING-type domain-containing protein n=1 Tax=Sinocyclocheilus rhinocerous TaxID=307959 RepID=A0A673IB25_9TELE
MLEPNSNDVMTVNFTACIGCFCGLGLIYSNKTCTMPSVTFQDLPLNIYMVIFGTGIFVFSYFYFHPCFFPLFLIVICVSTSRDVPPQQTCAVCLEDFKVKDELGVLPCQHAFHRRCVVKWLEVRCVCPMCNKALAGSSEQHQSTGTLLDELV